MVQPLRTLAAFPEVWNHGGCNQKSERPDGQHDLYRAGAQDPVGFRQAVY